MSINDLECIRNEVLYEGLCCLSNSDIQSIREIKEYLNINGVSAIFNGLYIYRDEIVRSDYIVNTIYNLLDDLKNSINKSELDESSYIEKAISKLEIGLCELV